MKFRDFLLATFLSLTLAFLAGEVWVRATKSTAPPFDRHYHPYLMIGGFFPRGWFPAWRDHREIPEAFGYKARGFLGVYAYDFSLPVKNAGERGRFLYRDRADLADPAPEHPGRKRYFIVGGSVAYGEGAKSPEARWWVVLERLLRERGRDLVTIPAANHSYASTQERVVVDLYVWPRRPDALVFLNGFNDAILHYEGMRPGDPFSQGLFYRRLESPFFNFLFHLSAHSALLRYMMATDMRTEQPIDEDSIARYADSVASLYIDNVREMKRRCDLEGVPCYFFLQPCRELTAHHRGDAGIARDERVFRSYQEILRRKAELPFLHDLTGVFDAEPDSSPFQDDAHFGDEGHRIVAREVAKVITAGKAPSRRKGHAPLSAK